MLIKPTKRYITLYVRPEEQAQIAKKAQMYGMSVSRLMVIGALNLKLGYEPISEGTENEILE